ncbi:hypothetical protein SLS59_001867 [Nothophoma quercina]|uniref:Uncharacterized protein n=1 Tax=Nothophoma quercina TaxID=749835 RepID=A0ABR3RWF4_9PLEO
MTLFSKTEMLWNSTLNEIYGFYNDKIATFEETLRAAQATNIASERNVAYLRHQLSNELEHMRSLITAALRAQPPAVVRALAENIVREADEARVLYLSRTTSNNDDLLIELEKKVHRRDIRIKELIETTNANARILNGTNQRVNRLESTISKQDETMTKFTNTHDAPTPAVTGFKHLSELQSKVDNHDERFRTLNKLSADVEAFQTDIKVLQADIKALQADIKALQAILKTSTEPSGQMEALRSTVSEIQYELNKHETDIETMRTSIDVLTDAKISFEDRIERTETSVDKPKDVSRDLIALDQRIDTLQEDSSQQEKQLGRLQDMFLNVKKLKQGMDSFYDIVPDMRLKLDKAVAGITACGGKVDQLRADVDQVIDFFEMHRGTLKSLQDDVDKQHNWAINDGEDIGKLFGRMCQCEVQCGIRKPGGKADAAGADEISDPGVIIHKFPPLDASAAGTECLQSLASIAASAAPTPIVAPVIVQGSGFNTSALLGQPFDISVPASLQDDGAPASRPNLFGQVIPSPPSKILPDSFSSNSAPLQKFLGTSRPLSRPSTSTPGPIGVLTALTPIADASVDVEMEGTDPDPNNPPEMDEEFEAELLAGEERLDDEDEELTDRDGDGETDDEMDQ